ncbi:MAG: hypothetical protein FWF83_01985 [Clostridiales bacterium]|nr:hypothetical protein [Clostridiales bacterium]
MQMFISAGVLWCGFANKMRRGAARFLSEEKGDLVSSLGWMAVMALALVLIKGIMDGKLVGYVNTIFTHLDRVFSP